MCAADKISTSFLGSQVWSGGILWKSMNRNEPKMYLLPNQALPASNQISASSGAKSKAPNTSGETQNLGV